MRDETSKDTLVQPVDLAIGFGKQAVPAAQIADGADVCAKKAKNNLGYLDVDLEISCHKDDSQILSQIYEALGVSDELGYWADANFEDSGFLLISIDDIDPNKLRIEISKEYQDIIDLLNQAADQDAAQLVKDLLDTIPVEERTSGNTVSIERVGNQWKVKPQDPSFGQDYDGFDCV